jgi:hypothetical protein
MAYATPEDLEVLLGRTLTDTEAETAGFQLELASGVIRAHLGQRPELVEDDQVVLDADDGGVLLLPETPVVGVTRVALVAVDGTQTELAEDAYAWTRDGVLRRIDGLGWGRSLRRVEVTYDHGYETLPEAIFGVCLALANRTMTNPAGVVSESIGTYAVTYGSGGAPTGMALGSGDLSALAPYRRGQATVLL